MAAWKNSIAPGLSGAYFYSFGNPAINDASGSAFLASIVGASVTGANNLGIWTDIGGTRRLIGRTGGAATGVTGGIFAKLSDPVSNSIGRTAFLGTLRLGVAGVTTGNETGIWSHASGSLKLIARTQGQAPGCPLGAKFASFSKLVLPDNGDVVFLASLMGGQGGVISNNNEGLWAVDSAGYLQLIVRKGSIMTVDSTQKTLWSISIFDGAAESNAQSRSVNHSGSLAFRLTFADGSQGVYRVVR